MNYYEYLGISMNASFEEIDKAYKKLALKFHPDTNSGDKYFEEQFKQLNEAHSILSDTDKRQKYDISLINETNKHFKIEELKRKAEEKEIELQKQIEIRKRQKEAYERKLQSQPQEKLQQQSYLVTTANTYKQEQKSIKKAPDKRKFWRRAVTIMLMITIGLGIVILSTKKGDWRSKLNDTQKTETETNKTATQKETKSKVKTKIDKKTIENTLTDSIKIDDKDSQREIEKHSDTTSFKPNQ